MSLNMRGKLFFYSETGTEGGLWAFQDEAFIFGNHWALEGLHVLENGDRLVICNPDSNEVIWEGEIKLRHFPPFTKEIDGLWVHDIQEGVDPQEWLSWFSQEYPAEIGQ